MDLSSSNEEPPPRDPRVTHTVSYTENEIESHRATYTGKKHRFHKKQSKDEPEEGPNEEQPRTTGRVSLARRGRLPSISIDLDDTLLTPPSQRVQFILGEDMDDTSNVCHPLFSEMEELVRNGEEMEWKETARWIKFEEDVEEGGNRWSKPHVATLSLHSLFELRSLLLNGCVMLDVEASSLEVIVDLFVEKLHSAELIVEEEAQEKIRAALLQRHRHQHERRKDRDTMNRLPIIRSLADIGKNHSSSKIDDVTNSQIKTSTPGNFLSIPGAGPGVDSGGVGGGMQKSASSHSMYRNHSGGDLNSDHKCNTHFMRKIPPGCEAANILVGELNFIDKTLSGFIRLKEAVFLGDLTEVSLPSRFIFILLGPSGTTDLHEVGRAMATLMSDEVFHEVAYKARNRTHLLAAMDEFLDAVTVLPPGEWDPSIRIEPPAAIPSQEIRKRPSDKPKDDLDSEYEEQKLREESGLSRTGILFGGLINDVKRKAPWYWSDFKEALALQCVASWIFLYFACLSPIITFGGLLSEATESNMAAMESLVSGFVCGMGYGFFSGQPLTILGSTGPVLVFETIVFDFCKQNSWDYMSFRLWIGLWIAFILIILVAIDASALVCYITRFTEENFATLIAFIFIYKAVENVLSIGKRFPVMSAKNINLSQDCHCNGLDSNVPGLIERQNSVDSVMFNSSNSNLVKMCLKYNGTVSGKGCFMSTPVPDVFLMSIILFLGTFILSVQLKDFKNALFFPSKVRQFISDFAVIIAISSMTCLDLVTGIKTPKLEVPSDFKPTSPTRTWIISPWLNPAHTCLIAILPAILGTILIFMDQQITAVIVNRKENKLKKGCGYHLDLFILSLLIVICSIMGLPWFVAATVLSINHVNSLKLESECAAPGEKPTFLGVREQRVTHILIFLMIGLSVLITPWLRYIPMPVLFGVFLYMGVASLKGLQFFDRILILLIPVKYQPDYMYLRQVPLKRVHLFTLIQLICLSVLWIIKSFRQTSILFPLMLVVMIGVRKLLDCLFTQRELKILDDVMPETIRSEEEVSLESSSNPGFPPSPNNPGYRNLQIPLANGNILKVPVTSINISEEVNKTGIWKQVNKGDKKIPPAKPSGGKKHKSRSHKKEDALTEEETKRLSITAEEEDDCDEEGLIIKDEKPKNKQSYVNYMDTTLTGEGDETCV
uniref:Anion exchange protein n=1 Tax=Cacopsylla melanoneura TaxID=428564 RepID=A0A8D8W5I7_9HEMI